jgi:hypothetical protein
MPNELTFYAQQEISTSEPTFLGTFRAAPYCRIRVLAYCPFDLGGGGVELSLTHIEAGSAPGALDRITLAADSSINQTYEVPGVLLGVSARAVADPPTSITVWIWGYRNEPGVPPAVGTSSPPSTDAQLVVHAVFDDGTGGPGESVGAGTVILLDGIDVGVTDETGTLTVQRQPGVYLVAAVIPSMAGGEREVTLEAGTTADVTVVLADQEITEAAELTLAELVNGALPLDTPTITLSFVNAGAVIPVTQLYGVELRPADPSAQSMDLSSLFTVTGDGIVTAVDVTSVISKVVAIASDSRLTVYASDDRGFSYSGEIVFVPGLYTVVVQLEAPPSQTALPVDGLDVQLRYGTGLELMRSSDLAGALQLLQVPGSMLELEVATEMNGLTYIGQAAIAVDANVRLLVRLLGIEDLTNGVIPWEVTTLATPVRLNSTPVRDGPAEELAPSRTRSPLAADRLAAEVTASAVSTVTVSAAGAGENIPITQTATLTVPQGTEKVILRYVISTAEYPYYVLRQSRYNDTWGVQVRNDTGGMLFSIGRAVNSQLYGSPAWGPFGDTGTLQQDIDVSALAAASEAKLTVVATTTNIGDGILPTDVVAVLGAEPKITINAATRDLVVPTVGASDRYSIPAPGDSNTFQRYFDLNFTKPDEVEITKVKAELMSGAGGVLQTVVDDEAPGTLKVQQIDETTMRVVVTFSDIASAVMSTPPPTDRIFYRFTMTGVSDAGDEVVSDPKDSAVFFALWRMPAGFGRYGQPPDPGLDDWAAPSTYTWLDANRGLVTRINDISGEHARNLGHHAHARGTDVDMFHVYTFPGGAVSGTANYMLLQADVERALGGDAAALARVNTWAVDTRTRFDAFIADAGVHRIRYAIGSAAHTAGMPALTGGWARALLTAGNYINPTGIALALPAGIWGNGGHAKLWFDAVHNNHFHLDL